MNSIKKIVLLSLIGVSLFSGRVAFAQEEPEDKTSEVSTVDVSFEKGPLRMNSASPFKFNNKEIAVLEKTYTADAPVTVSLTDNRGYSESNFWKLTATLNPFTNGEGKPSLDGASITLKSPDPQGQSNFSKPTVGTQSDNTVTLLPSPEGSEETPVATAQRTEIDDSVGVGEWNITWGKDDIVLTVLQNTASEGNHSTTINWQLKDAP